VPVLVDSFSAHCEALTLNYLGGFSQEGKLITGGVLPHLIRFAMVHARMLCCRRDWHCMRIGAHPHKSYVVVLYVYVAASNCHLVYMAGVVDVRHPS
jgi:hypothetical protein